MTRPVRIPYHQNLYDLLGVGPAVDPEADRMVAAHEAAHGPPPAAVREWYVYPDAVPLRLDDGRPGSRKAKFGMLWYTFSNSEQVPALATVLRRFATREVEDPEDWEDGGPPVDRFVEVMCENQAVVRWWVERDAGDDPPVWIDNDDQEHPDGWDRAADSFSAFVFDLFATHGFPPDWGGVPESVEQLRRPLPGLAAHANRLWLRAAAEPLVAPVLDYLADLFGEPESTTPAAGIVTRTYRPGRGTIRVTTTDEAWPTGPPAWWVHAATVKRLAELAPASSRGVHSGKP